MNTLTKLMELNKTPVHIRYLKSDQEVELKKIRKKEEPYLDMVFLLFFISIIVFAIFLFLSIITFYKDDFFQMSLLVFSYSLFFICMAKIIIKNNKKVKLYMSEYDELEVESEKEVQKLQDKYKATIKENIDDFFYLIHELKKNEELSNFVDKNTISIELINDIMKEKNKQMNKREKSVEQKSFNIKSKQKLEEKVILENF